MNEIEAFIRQTAAEIGVDPDVAVAVARSEGGLKDPFRRGQGPAPRSQAAGLGSTENSFGPFQLYISGTNAGLGDRAVAAGIDPRKDWRSGVRFGLEEAKQKGWGQWYGAANTGIGKWQGIRGGPGRDYRGQVANEKARAQAKQYGLPPVDPLGVFPGANAPAAANAPAGPVEAAGGGAGAEAADWSPSAPAAPAAAKDKQKNWWDLFGEGIAAGAGAMGGGGFNYQVPQQPGPARVDVGAAPIIDPQQAEMKRQMLAMAMQRLNAGSLWG